MTLSSMRKESFKKEMEQTREAAKKEKSTAASSKGSKSKSADAEGQATTSRDALAEIEGKAAKKPRQSKKKKSDENPEPPT